MSAHVEWVEPVGEIATAGETVGEHAIDEGNVALVFGTDSIAVVEGEVDTLRSMLYFLLAQLEDDTASSVSRQHYVDTGRYLTVAEVQAIEEGDEPALTEPCKNCGEAESEGYGLCGECFHNAVRSGWTPGDEAGA